MKEPVESDRHFVSKNADSSSMTELEAQLRVSRLAKNPPQLREPQKVVSADAPLQRKATLEEMRVIGPALAALSKKVAPAHSDLMPRLEHPTSNNLHSEGSDDDQ
jgi:hypothetical protein